MPTQPLTAPAPVNFGTDTSCLDSLNTGRMASGLQLVAESVYRRLTTTRGTLFGGDDEANFGLNLEDVIGQVTTPSAAAALPGQIEAELQKDERIESVTATVVPVISGPSTSWTITIAAQTALGPFSLVLSVSEVTTQLLGITAGT